MASTILVGTAGSEAHAIRRAAQRDRLLTANGLQVSAAALVRAAHERTVERVVPGVYLGAEHTRGPLTEAAAWTLRHPGAVVGLLTAAVIHELTDAFPRGSWLLVRKGASPPRSRVVRVQVVQVSPERVDPAHDGENGIVTRQVHGVRVRLTHPDRTVIDLWRYPRRIPVEHALDALRRRIRSQGFHLPAFARLARRLGVWDRLEPIVQGAMLR